MPRQPAPPIPRPPPDDEPEAFVAWALATNDLMAFREALRHVAADRWLPIHALLVAQLSPLEPRASGQGSGYAAQRDRRGRAAARVVKLDLLQQQDDSRSLARDADARALKRQARLADEQPDAD
jgi:hypothetical protein